MTTIRTNNQAREILRWWDLSKKEQREFDYLVPEDYWTAYKRHQRDVEHIYDDEPEASFFRYLGQVYNLGDFIPIDTVMRLHFPELKYWGSYQADSFFSGILVRYVSCETIVVGSYCS